jgi:hypothetical protein
MASLLAGFLPKNPIMPSSRIFGHTPVTQYSPVQTVVTDAAGGFSLPKDGSHSMLLKLKAAGFIERKVDPAAGGKRSQRIVMRRAGKLEGRVLSPDAKPLAGAALSVIYSENYPDDG